MPDTIIDRIFADNKVLTSYLGTSGEWSMQSNVDGEFRKVLILSAARFFESHLTENLIQIFSDKTDGSQPVVEFIKNKGISRQYHTYFQWEKRNANSFFGLFGPDFREHMVTQATTDTQLELSIRSFLELGELRNKLVHMNFANFPLDKTVDEIYSLYSEAYLFIEKFLVELRNFLQGNALESNATPQ